MNQALQSFGQALGNLLGVIALFLLLALMIVLSVRWFSYEESMPAGPVPSEMSRPAPRPHPPAAAEMPTPRQSPPASDSPVATQRADKLGTVTGQKEPEAQGSRPFQERVAKALTLLRERVPTGYQYVLHLGFIREGAAKDMAMTSWGRALAQTVNCGHPGAGAILGPDDRGPVDDAATLAHEGAHIALRLCGPNSHADGRVFAVDLLVRHDLEDSGFAERASFARKVALAEGGQ